MEDLDKKIKKEGASTGLILGIITLVLGILNFYYMTAIATSFWPLIMGPLVISVLIPIVIAIIYSKELRKKIGGFWNFKQATTGLFIMFFVSYLISFTGNMIFMKVVEPNGIDKLKTAMVTATTTMMEKSNVSDEQKQASIEKTEKSFEDQKDQSAGKIAKGVAIAVLVSFIFALIFAAFLKKEAPLAFDGGDYVAPESDTTA
jgi:hypothetical protein